MLKTGIAKLNELLLQLSNKALRVYIFASRILRRGLGKFEATLPNLQNCEMLATCMPIMYFSEYVKGLSILIKATL